MASNTYVNKVVYGGSTIIDLTSDTVDAAHLANNYTAHSKSGAAITGTAELAKPEQSKTTVTNGTVTPDSGYTLSSVVVSIPTYSDLS